MATSHTEHTLIGRETELSTLTAAYDDAVSGSGRVVMLVGEPGIGKTRLAEELAASTGDHAHVLWGRVPEQQAPPYWPWAQLIRTYIGNVDADHLRSALGRHGPAIAELVPEVRESLPDLADLPETPETTDSDQARFQLFDAVSSFLTRAAGSKPLVLILDDLHWADSASLKLLEFVATNVTDAALLIVGTYRDVELSRRHPLAETLGSIGTSSAFRRIPVRGLTGHGVGELIATVAGTEVSASLVQEIHDRTSGNPFFVSEVARDLVDSGRLSERQPGFRIPEGVHEAIGRRLNRLSDEANEILTTAAVVGRDFSLNVLVDVSEGTITEARLLDGLDEALKASLIEEHAGGGGRYQFTHALVQETLAAELSASRRLRLHFHIGETLERLYGDHADDHADELVRHFAEAGQAPGDHRIFHYSRIAGEHALATHGYEESVAHFDRALFLRSAVSIDSDEAAIRVGMSRGQASLGLLSESVESLKKAIDFYLETDDIESAAAALRDVHTVGFDRSSVELFSRVIERISEESPHLGYVLASYGLVVGGMSADYETASAALDRSVRIAVQTGDRRLEASALANAANVDGLHLRLEAMSAHAASALVALPPGDESITRFRALLWAGHSAAYAGRHQDGLDRFNSLYNLAERRHDAIWMGNALCGVARIHSALGEWELATQATIRAASLVEDTRWGPVYFLATLVAQEVAAQTGNQDELIRSLTHARRIAGKQIDPSVSRDLTSLYALAGHTGGLPEMTSAAAELLRQYVELDEPPISRSADAITRALVGYETQDLSLAQESLNVLGRGGQLILGSAISVDRLRGLACRTIGRLDQASKHFDDAITRNRNEGRRPDLAWACFEYAEMLFDGGDRANVGALLDEALAITSELGMTPLEARLTALKERLGTRSGASTRPDGLTARQLDVLRLVVAGRTNQEIADELVISIHTVLRHMQNIFGKIGASNRTEAAAYAVRNGLDSQE